ncbi:MAG: alpha/beta fold hydrolase [Dehalococcoidia bacterium]
MNRRSAMKPLAIFVISALVALVSATFSPASVARADRPAYSDQDPCEIGSQGLVLEWEGDPSCEGPEQSEYDVELRQVSTGTQPIDYVYAQASDAGVCVYGDGTSKPDITIDFPLGDYGPVTGTGEPSAGHAFYGQELRLAVGAYDVDSSRQDALSAVGGWQGLIGELILLEKDVVSWYDTSSGDLIGRAGELQGRDGQDSTADLWFPASMLRFSDSGTPVVNRLGIDIDTLHNRISVAGLKLTPPAKVFCVEINQVSLVLTPRFTPTVLVHGWNSDSGSMTELAADISGLQLSIETEPSSSGGNESYKSRYEDIDTAVNALLNDVGGTRVNIIAHSHGGIAARYYAFKNPDKVAQVVMLGTPNGGTALANAWCEVENGGKWKLSALAGLVGGPVAFIMTLTAQEAIQFGFHSFEPNVDCSSGTGFADLKTSSMDSFNRAVLDRNRVVYSVVAGFESGGGVEWGSSRYLDGPNDAWVTVESAMHLRSAPFEYETQSGTYALDIPNCDAVFTSPAQQQRYWWSCYATTDLGLRRLHQPLAVVAESHTNLPGKEDHESEALPYVFCQLYQVCSQSLSLDNANVAILPTEEAVADTWVFETALIVPAEDQVEIPVAFEDSQLAHISLLSDDVESLTATIDSASMVVAEALPGIDGLALELENPNDDDLVVVNSSESDVAVQVQVFISTTKRLAVSAADVLPVEDEETVISLALSDADESEDAYIVISDSAFNTVVSEDLEDSATGTWTYDWTPTSPGLYHIDVLSVGDATLRSASLAVWVAPDGYSINSVESVDFEETSGDDYMDEVLLEVEVTVPAAGDYVLSGTVRDDEGTVLTSGASPFTALATGTHSLVITVSGEAIRALAEDSVITLAETYLYLDGEDGLVPVAYVDLVEDDLDLDLTQLQPLAPGFDIESLSVDGLDVNEDDVLEGIVVSGEFWVSMENEYRLQAALCASTGEFIDFVTELDYYEEGTHEFSLTFDADAIITSGQSGSFSICDLRIEMPYGPSSEPWEEMGAGVYSRSDFDPDETVASAASLGVSKTFDSGSEGHLTFVPITIAESGRYGIESDLDADGGLLTLMSADGSTLMLAGLDIGPGFISDIVIDEPGNYMLLFESFSSSDDDVTLTVRTVGEPTVVEADVDVPDSGTTVNLGQALVIEFEADIDVRYGLEFESQAVMAGTVIWVQPESGPAYSVEFEGGEVETLPTFPDQAGTHYFVIVPSGPQAGEIDFTITTLEDAVGSIATDGTPAVIETTHPLQRAVFEFSLSTAGRYAVRITSEDITLGYVSLEWPASSTYDTVVDGFSFIDAQELNQVGTYQLIVESTSEEVGEVTAEVIPVSDITGSITPGGSEVEVDITTPGQNALLSWTGVASDQVSVLVPTSTIASGQVRILKPDGSTLASTALTTGGATIGEQSLPSSGTYTVVVDPAEDELGSADVKLLDDSGDFVGTIVPGGSPVGVTISTANQNAKLTFDATAGQRISTAFANSGLGSTYIKLIRPNGTTQNTTFTTGSGGFQDLQVLASTGTYTIVVDPLGSNAGSGTVTLYDVPADDGGSITPGDPAEGITIATPGQNAAFTFSASPGDRISVEVTSSTLGSSYVRLYRPNGTQQAFTFFSTSTAFLDLQELDSTGTYSVVIDPSTTGTGSATVKIHDVPADDGGTITPGDPAEGITISTPGQNATFTFSASPGDRISVEVTSSTLGSGYVRLYRPNGTQQGFTFFSTSAAFLGLQELDTTGTYSVVVDPSTTGTGSATVKIHDVPADDTDTTTIGGAAVQVSTTVPGQRARVTFSATASDVVDVVVTSASIYPTAIKLLKPDGSTLSTNYIYGTSYTLQDKTLPVTGTYTVEFVPTGANIGDATVQVVAGP